jgi:hypothetical protein
MFYPNKKRRSVLLRGLSLSQPDFTARAKHFAAIANHFHYFGETIRSKRETRGLSIQVLRGQQGEIASPPLSTREP